MLGSVGTYNPNNHWQGDQEARREASGTDTVWIQLRKLTQLHGHKHGRVETYFCPERGKAAHPLLKAVGGHIALGQPED